MPPVRRSIGPGFIRIDTMAAKLAVGVVVASVFFALAKDWVGLYLPLIPSAMVRFPYAVWEPLTYAFVGGAPLEVIFGALIVWSMGMALEASWGPRRLLLFALGTTISAAVLTVGLALVSDPLMGKIYFGVFVMSTNLWVAYGLAHGNAPTNFWGMPVSGNMLAAIGAGFVFLNGAYAGWLAVVPEVIGIALTVAYMKGASPRLLWLRFTSWRLQRQLRGRSKHLKVVSRDRNIGGGSDGFLH